MILVSDHFTEKAFSKIENLLSDYNVKRMSENSNDVKALIIRSKDSISLDTLDKYPNLEIVASATSGFDHIDFKSLKKSGVKLCYSPNANIDSASELTVFHILNFLKKGRALLTDSPLSRSNELLGEELSAKKVSIIGLGRIGSKVAAILKAFGCEVSAYDPYINPGDFKGVKSISFDEALSSADIVSLHCPLTHVTKNMINKESLSLIKPSSILINCARGELVNEADLIESLKSQKIAGACLDVFEKEPLSEASPLLKLNNTLTTPHIGGFTAQAHEKSALEAAQQVKKWFELGSPVLSSIPPDVAWSEDL